MGTLATNGRAARKQSRSEIVATRTFVDKGGRRIIASFYRPYRVAKGEWLAQFAVRGLAQAHSDRALGADSLQALLLATDVLRVWLESLDIEFTWLKGEVGYTGIPRTIQDIFGLEFSKRAERLVEIAAAKFVAQRRKG